MRAKVNLVCKRICFYCYIASSVTIIVLVAQNILTRDLGSDHVPEDSEVDWTRLVHVLCNRKYIFINVICGTRVLDHVLYNIKYPMSWLLVTCITIASLAWYKYEAIKMYLSNTFTLVFHRFPAPIFVRDKMNFSWFLHPLNFYPLHL